MGISVTILLYIFTEKYFFFKVAQCKKITKGLVSSKSTGSIKFFILMRLLTLLQIMTKMPTRHPLGLSLVKEVKDFDLQGPDLPGLDPLQLNPF